jgi:hypothetical protein
MRPAEGERTENNGQTAAATERGQTATAERVITRKRKRAAGIKEKKKQRKQKQINDGKTKDEIQIELRKLIKDKAE